MTYAESKKLCFAFNTSKNNCRCLNFLYCKDGNGKNCKFYKPRDDEDNNQKMREFTLKQKKYNETKTIYKEDTEELSHKDFDKILNELDFE